MHDYDKTILITSQKCDVIIISYLVFIIKRFLDTKLSRATYGKCFKTSIHIYARFIACPIIAFLSNILIECYDCLDLLAYTRL